MTDCESRNCLKELLVWNMGHTKQQTGHGKVYPGRACWLQSPVHSILTDQSPLAQADQPVLPINPGLYLRPDDDLIECDEGPESADSDSDALVAPRQSMSYEKSAKRHSAQLDVTYDDLHWMLWEFRPFGSYEHTGLESIQDWLGAYKDHTGNLADLSIQQIMEAERPFCMAWAETSDKLRRADVDLLRMQRAERLSVKMLKSQLFWVGEPNFVT
ncbi:hypothetical protein BDR03DRAFT_982338 [Suillus americanus]|nr:hypothetical protein BDR03DRAFT_982338 [Suillus americanus]